MHDWTVLQLNTNGTVIKQVPYHKEISFQI